MSAIQQQTAADLQPHKKCSIIADSTYDSSKREATVFVTGESHTVLAILALSAAHWDELLDTAAAVRGDAGRENVTSCGATSRRLQHS